MRRRKSPHKLFHFISFSVERKKKKSLLDSIRYDGNFLDFVNGATETMSDDGEKKSIRIRCAVMSANRRKIFSPRHQIFSSPVPLSLLTDPEKQKTTETDSSAVNGWGAFRSSAFLIY